MKRLKYFLAILILGFSSCSKDRQWEEGDRNTFTWKGKVVKDCYGEPVSNAEVFLETGGYTNPDEDWTEIIATGMTDENGNFSLTYKKIKSQSYGVKLSANDRSLMSAPANQDIERDVAMEDCDMVYIEIENISGVDSIYVALGKPRNHPYRFTITLNEIDSTIKVPVMGIPLFKSNYRDTLYLPTIVGTSWDNKAFESKFTYSTELSEIRKYLISYMVDSIPDGYNAYPYNRSGYPVVDEVYIEI